MVTNFFFSISDNSNHTHGVPWIQYFAEGTRKGRVLCSVCRWRECDVAKGDLLAALMMNRPSAWPAILGGGASVSPLIVAEYVLRDWEQDAVGSFPVGGEVTFLEPLPGKLEAASRPRYYWLDGTKMFGARFKEGTRAEILEPACPACGRRRHDIGAEIAVEDAGYWPYVLVDWEGANLFKVSPTQSGGFFCTSAVVESARRHRHTNFRFIPAEAGAGTWSEGIDYLGKVWPPPRHPLRRSEGHTLDEWVELLRDPDNYWEARCAVLELGEEAFPAEARLTEMLDDRDARVREEAALLLHQFRRRGAQLNPKAMDAAEKYALRNE